MKKKQKYYVVWAGVAPGIYDSWTDCQLQTKGYEGARFKSFDTREEAERAFASSPSAYIGRCPSQVDEFLSECVRPAIAPYLTGEEIKVEINL